MSNSFYFPDNLHFNNRNFPSLHKFIRVKKAKYYFNPDLKEWRSAFGDYSNYEEELEPALNILSLLCDKLDLFEIEYQGSNLFKLIRSELLSFFLPFPSLYREANGLSDDDLLQEMLRIDEHAVKLNFAAGIYWLDYWRDKIGHISTFKYCMIFSGSQIYNRTLLELLKTTTTEPIVSEHFFTGTEYYFENKYSPIANNTDFKFKNVYESYGFDSGLTLEREKIKAINKIINIKNKNVTQPSQTNELLFDNDNKFILILGQVINDFSIIETATNYLSSAQFYDDLISEILEKTDYNIVFKAHPWEHKKSNVRSPLTKNFIEEQFGEFSNRVKVLDDYNIYQLFESSSHIVALCSQSVLEAAFRGYKCSQLGNAFYGGFGFTHDYKTIDSFVLDLCNDKLTNVLSMAELDDYLEYMTIILQQHLVSVFDSGLTVLNQKLKTVHIPSVSESQSKIHLVDVEIKRLENNINKSKPLKFESTEKKKNNSKGYSIIRKLMKLKKNPYGFFNDSRYRSLKSVSRALKK